MRKLDYNNTVYWDNVFSGISHKPTTYDLWLDKYMNLIEEWSGYPVLDLGCGTGNNSLYLKERGFNVIAADSSKEALKIVNENVPGVSTINFDISTKMPFADNTFGVVVADLSLHYFSDEDTESILTELKRILHPNGLLLCRLNSTDDFNYSAKGYSFLQRNFYKTDVGFKRFFDEEEISFFFKSWDIHIVKKVDMCRYDLIKKVYEVVLINR